MPEALDCPTPLGSDTTWLVYDGECPFCRNYAQYIQLKTALPGLQIVSARDRIGELWSRLPVGADAYNLDEGMLVWIDGKWHYGAEALHVLSDWTHSPGLLSRVHRVLFSHLPRSHMIYPWLNRGRKLFLRLTGHSLIGK